MEASPASHAKLFFVLVHGLFGSNADLEKLRHFILSVWPNALVLLSSTNSSSTTRGVRRGGRRLTMEILNCLLDHYGLPALTRAQRHANQEESTLAEVRSLLQGKQTHAHDRLQLAIVGHSLGGLYSRNALGLLHRGGYFHSQQGVLTPFEYMSISTPHLGSRRPRAYRNICTWALKKCQHVSVRLGVQTGKDLMLADHSEQPVLLEMTQPDSVYFQALQLFRRTVVATTHHDDTVPFASAAILLHNPFPKPQRSSPFCVLGASGFQSSQQAILQELAGDDTTFLQEGAVDDAVARLAQQPLPELPGPYVYDSEGYVETLPDMVNNLQSLSWRRIFIQFPQGHMVETLLTHQMPLAKSSSARVTNLLPINIRKREAETFLELLVRVMEEDLD